MTAANQHIEIDGRVLQKQASVMAEVGSSFATASGAVNAALPGNAFGMLSQGLVVPLANALAGASRELLATAHDLADRVATGIEQATTTFSSVEEGAVDTFSKADR